MRNLLIIIAALAALATAKGKSNAKTFYVSSAHIPYKVFICDAEDKLWALMRCMNPTVWTEREWKSNLPAEYEAEYVDLRKPVRFDPAEINWEPDTVRDYGHTKVTKNAVTIYRRELTCRSQNQGPCPPEDVQEGRRVRDVYHITNGKLVLVATIGAEPD